MIDLLHPYLILIKHIIINRIECNSFVMFDILLEKQIIYFFKHKIVKNKYIKAYIKITIKYKRKFRWASSTFRETFIFVSVMCKENVREQIERNGSFVTKSSGPKSRRWQVYFFASRYLEKIFSRARERKTEESRIVGQKTRERDREKGDAYGR